VRRCAGFLALLTAALAAGAEGGAQVSGRDGGVPPSRPGGVALARAESLLAGGDTLAAESLAAEALHAARGDDVNTYLAADRLLLAIATSRAKTDPDLASARYRRLTGRAEAESLLAIDLERRRDELRRTDLMLRATDVDSLQRQLGGPAATTSRAGPARSAEAGRAAAGLSVDAGGGAGSASSRPGQPAGPTPGSGAGGTGGRGALLVGAGAGLVLGAIALRHLASRRRRRG
jgi:hypothetical protein